MKMYIAEIARMVSTMLCLLFLRFLAKLNDCNFDLIIPLKRVSSRGILIFK